MMSKRPFDHIENKIREAAENSEPLFNEQAWAKMELLLDKEKKRRFLFWWRFGFPILLAGMAAGGWLIYNITNAKKVTGSPTAAVTEMPQQNNQVPATQLKPAVDTTLRLNQRDSKLTAPADASKQNSAPNIVKTKAPLLSPPFKNTSDKGIISTGKPDSSLSSSIVKAHTGKKRYRSTKARATVNISAEYGNNVNGNVTDDVEQPGIINPTGTTGTNQQPDDEAFDNLPRASSYYKTFLDTVSHEEEKIATELSDDNEMPDSVTKKVAEKKKTTSRFYLLVGGGAEIIKTKFLSYGNSDASARFGAGIGYNISERFSIQTGFYAGRKKYTGSGGDYHPKQGSYWSMVNLKKVNGSCLVYDIPVSLRYNLKVTDSRKIYAMAAVSSFIMKKEDYHYWYTYNNTPSVTQDKAYSYTGNKNLFSVLTLSAGIEKKVADGLFVLAEPYISLPISGVGEGMVKLYSTGLQLSIKYQPKF